ncbi:uncharacterized protein [Antedon mediterranea]|uniref:uncharacterized protein n=1 Tax=Antedon mediterranea TaxID=105859 RepID=UPI003AF4F4CC
MIYFLNFNMESESATIVDIQLEQKTPRCGKRKKTRRGRKRKLISVSQPEEAVSSTVLPTPTKNRRRGLAWKPNLRPLTIPAPRPDDFDPVEEWYRVPNTPTPAVPEPTTSDELISPSEYYLQMYGTDEIESSKVNFSLPLSPVFSDCHTLHSCRNLTSDGESCGQSSTTSKSDCESPIEERSRHLAIDKTSASNFDLENEQALLDDLHSMTRLQLIQKYFDLKTRLRSLEGEENATI